MPNKVVEFLNSYFSMNIQLSSLKNGLFLFAKTSLVPIKVEHKSIKDIQRQNLKDDMR